jgi:hypothetical protein
MLQKIGGLALLLCLGGLIAAEDKDKDKAKVKATLVKLDKEKNTLAVKIAGKDETLELGKATAVFGPHGGKATVDDPRLWIAGNELGLVIDGKELKEIHLPSVAKKKDRKDKKK